MNSDMEDRIARAIEVIGEQLTRIADRLNKDSGNHPEAEGYDWNCALQIGGYVCTCSFKPAPDVAGLVEAVEKYLETITLSPSAKGCFTLDDLRSALDAHKPEAADAS